MRPDYAADRQKLANVLVTLIRQRERKNAPDELRKEIRSYLSLLFHNAFALDRDVRNTDKPDVHKELSELQTNIETTLAQAQALSSDSQLHLRIHYALKGNSDPFIDEYDKLIARLDEAFNLVYEVSENIKEKPQGRPQNFKQKEFYELALQIFERCTGQSFEELHDNADTIEARKIKGHVIDIIEYSNFFTVPRDSIRKTLNRYLEDNRPERDWVEDILNNSE